MKNVYVVYTYERDVVVKPVTIQIKYKIEYEQIWSIRGDEHTHEHTNTRTPSSTRQPTESYHKRDVYHLVVYVVFFACHFSAQVFKDTIIGGDRILFTLQVQFVFETLPECPKELFASLSKPTVIVLCTLGIVFDEC